MASSNISLNFTAEMTDAARGMAELIKLENEFDASLQKVGKSAKSSGSIVEQMGKNMSEIPGQFSAMFASMAAGFVSANALMSAGSKAVDAVKDSYKDLIRIQKEAGQAAIETGKQIIQAAGLGNLGDLDAFQKKTLGAALSAGVDVGTYTSAYAEFRASAPNAGENKSFEAISNLSKLNNLTDVVSLAKKAGEISKGLPELSGSDAADLALLIEKKAGGQADVFSESMLQLKQMKSAGMDSKDAMSLILGMTEKGYSSKQIGSMGQILTETINPTDKRAKTDKERIQNELSAIGTGKARMEWIAANPEKAKSYFGESLYKLMPAMQPEMISSGKTLLDTVFSQDLVQNMVGQASGSLVYKQQELDDAFEIAAKNSKLKASPQQIEGQVREGFEKWLKNQEYLYNSNDYGSRTGIGGAWGRSNILTMTELESSFSGKSYAETVLGFMEKQYNLSREPGEKEAIKPIVDALRDILHELKSQKNNQTLTISVPTE